MSDGSDSLCDGFSRSMCQKEEADGQGSSAIPFRFGDEYNL
jgi:hypothetical protein